jgi:hypothetical protein
MQKNNRYALLRSRLLNIEFVVAGYSDVMFSVGFRV